MIKCKYCQAENTGKSRFCLYCGNPLNLGSQSAPAKDQSASGAIHKSVLPDENAGSSQTQPFNDDLPALSQGRNSSSAKYIYGGVAAVIVGIGVIFLVKELSNGKDQAQVLDANTTETYDMTPADTASSFYSLKTEENNPETPGSSNTGPTYSPNDNDPSTTEKENTSIEVDTGKDTEGEEFRPEEAIFSFVGSDTWFGQITYANEASSFNFQLKAGYRRLRMETEAFHCPTALTYKSFTQLEGDYTSFLFDEILIDATSKCEAGLVGITASPTTPNQIYIQFYDADGAPIAKGFLYRK